MENLCRHFSDLSVNLQQQLAGQTSTEVPKSIDSQLTTTRRALQAELVCLTGGKISSFKKGKGKNNSNDASVLRSAWKALTTLKNQLYLKIQTVVVIAFKGTSTFLFEQKSSTVVTIQQQASWYLPWVKKTLHCCC